jgi:hypothetical protein
MFVVVAVNRSPPTGQVISSEPIWSGSGGGGLPSAGGGGGGIAAAAKSGMSNVSIAGLSFNIRKVSGSANAARRNLSSVEKIRNDRTRRYFTCLQRYRPAWVGTNASPFSSQWNGPLFGTWQFRPPSSAANAMTPARIAAHAKIIHRFRVK